MVSKLDATPRTIKIFPDCVICIHHFYVSLNEIIFAALQVWPPLAPPDVKALN
jgi:hypothetical protein